MIHLFNRVYLNTDELIELEHKKIFISEVSIKFLLEDIQNKKNTILESFINFEEIIQKYNSLDNFLFRLSTVNEKIIIYANEKNYLLFLISFLTSLLKNCDEEKMYYLIKSFLFRDSIFNDSRFNFGHKKKNKICHTLNLKNYKKNYSLRKKENFERFKGNFSVEYLLCSFLFNGLFKEELKLSMINLIRKDLVKYLYELKEIFLVHMRTPHFTNKLGLKRKYDFSNFDEILNDNSKFTNLFTTKRIWNKSFKNTVNDVDSIILENITEEDITNFKEFTIISGSSWIEESCYIFMKSDVNKLDFLPIFKNFTDDLLYKIIEAESTFDHSAGSFFSIDLGTVNHYFIYSILENKSNKEFLKYYTLS
jgi:hypothetical protein